MKEKECCRGHERTTGHISHGSRREVVEVCGKFHAGRFRGIGYK